MTGAAALNHPPRGGPCKVPTFCARFSTKRFLPRSDEKLMRGHICARKRPRLLCELRCDLQFARVPWITLPRTVSSTVRLDWLPSSWNRKEVLATDEDR